MGSIENLYTWVIHEDCILLFWLFIGVLLLTIICFICDLFDKSLTLEEVKTHIEETDKVKNIKNKVRKIVTETNKFPNKNQIIKKFK